MKFNDLRDAILEDCAMAVGVPFQVIEEDFAKFNAEIDRLISEGLTEDEALAEIWNYWIIPNTDVCED